MVRIGFSTARASICWPANLTGWWRQRPRRWLSFEATRWLNWLNGRRVEWPHRVDSGNSARIVFWRVVDRRQSSRGRSHLGNAWFGISRCASNGGLPVALAQCRSGRHGEALRSISQASRCLPKLGLSPCPSLERGLDIFDFLVTAALVLVEPFKGPFSERDIDAGTVTPSGSPRAYRFSLRLASGRTIYRSAPTGRRDAHARGAVQRRTITGMRGQGMSTLTTW